MNDRKPTRVALASDQAIYLRGLASLLTSLPGIQLVGEARSGAEARQLCQLTQPDLVLLDLRNDNEQGRELARHVQQVCPAIRAILLCDCEEESQAEEHPEGPQLFTFSRDLSEEEFKAALEQILQAAPAQAASFSHQAEPPVEENNGGERASQLSRNEEIMTRELVMAGRIQADILPEKEPSLPGWEITAKLAPARETSGDFYDFIPLSEHKWGIIVADVTDKGMGAALFMALASTLIRTYASRFPTLPGLALSAVSERLLSDTRGGMFVTTFFGILEPHTGRLIFANAGHPPGCLIHTQRGHGSVDELRRTGMALGVSEVAQWKQKIVRLLPGDFLVLYTDGITEAQSPQGDFFGDERLMDLLLSKVGSSAIEIQDALLAEVHRFVGSSHPQDDIALIVIRRTEE